MKKRRRIFILAVLAAVICTFQIAGARNAEEKRNGDTLPDSLSIAAKGNNSLDSLFVTSEGDTLRYKDIVRDTSSQYSQLFLQAVEEFVVGNMKQAFDMFKDCIALDSTASEAYYYLGKCYLAEHEDSLATAMMLRAAELQPENTLYKEELIPDLLDKQDLQRAAEIAEEIVSDDPERSDILQLLMQIYAHLKDNEKGLSALERLETLEGQDESFTTAKVQIYSQMGEEEKALEALSSLVENNPLDLNYRVMRGNWLLGLGKKEEALKDLKYVLDEEPENENAVMSMMDYFRSEGNDSLANNYRDKLLTSQKTQQDTKILLLKQAIRAAEQESTDSTRILQLFDKILSAEQPNTNMLELKAAYMQLKKMPEKEVKTVFEQILEKNPGNGWARHQLIMMAWSNEQIEEMIRLAQPAIEYNPEDCSFGYFLGTAYFLTGKTELCVSAIERALSVADEKNDKGIMVEMYSLLGDAFFRLGEKSRGYAAYEKCLALDPEKTSCLNNYAYFLSLDKRDLDKAAAMSLKTIKAEPDNATYLDTYAWILYQQKRYEEAKIYIDLALKYDDSGDSAELLKHKKAIEKKLSNKK